MAVISCRWFAVLVAALAAALGWALMPVHRYSIAEDGRFILDAAELSVAHRPPRICMGIGQSSSLIMGMSIGMH